MTNEHDENRCSNCARYQGESWAVDGFKGTGSCFLQSVQDGDLVCLNFTPKEGGEND